MYFPQFLMGMFATSLIVAIWADFQTGSGWQALGWAILALIILQVGYVGLVVRLIYRQGPKGSGIDLAPKDSPLPIPGDVGNFRQRRLLPDIKRSQPPRS
ncbi:MAG: hypothetical protein EOS36_16100 [Mesorhizobium sp.]|uniref:hypothetical protein n=1 Tax=Mesorhizobium sp. TaxID=1871066 RepID=UPI000FEA2BCD|nr:hypothetical protein [Mesorhizobium sp.]RWD62062.1 MAG: hypothetical protein EOS36_16100 [Mesorhizobium sp.]RWE36261.1 MAG: hypothetical protein EOS79_26210 [Mesorhizobium sp.]